MKKLMAPGVENRTSSRCHPGLYSELQCEGDQMLSMWPGYSWVLASPSAAQADSSA